MLTCNPCVATKVKYDDKNALLAQVWVKWVFLPIVITHSCSTVISDSRLIVITYYRLIVITFP